MVNSGLSSIYRIFYIQNDLFNVSNVLEFIFFADDTNIFFSHKDINSLFTNFNLEMTKLSDWGRANKLSINSKKSTFMIFQPRKKKKKI